MMTKYVINNTSTRDTFLHFHRYSFDENEKQALLEVIDSGWIGTGPKTKEFESNFASYIGCKHAIALNSCTAGLHLSLIANGIGCGDEVIVPVMTFSATANVVVHTGATPVFVDIEAGTLNINPEKIVEKITPKTKAIIPVHMAGQPCKMDEIRKIAADYNLVIIEDAAHATESFYKSDKIGNISPLTAFSFYATKNITTAEGGMVTTNDDSLAEKVRVLSLHGLSKDAWKRYSDSGFKIYDVNYPGFKYNMPDIQGALGICQLKKIDQFLQARNKHKQTYDNLLKEVSELSFIEEIPEITHARHLYMVRFNSDNFSRNQLMEYLTAQKIGVSLHFISLHHLSYYRNRFELKDSDFPEATKASNSLISLPFFPAMKEEDIVYVTDKIKEAINKFS